MISINKALKFIIVILLIIVVDARIKVDLYKANKENQDEYLTEEEEKKNLNSFYVLFETALKYLLPACRLDQYRCPDNPIRCCNYV